MKRLSTWALIVAAASVASGCTFEHRGNLVAPSVPGFPSSPPPTGGTGSLTGVWASQSGLTLPASWTCGNFQWNVTSQTSTSLSGDFAALCAGVVLVSGHAAGQLNGDQVRLDVNGTAVVQGIISCPFSLSSDGRIEGETLRLPYSGQTCLGPVQGEEVLRRPASGAPPPAPEPPPPPPPGGNPHHVGPGPLSVARAEQVVYATGNEFAHLRAPRPTESEAVSAAEELLLRTVWHLRLAGYNAGRQRNPSGAISNDKLTIQIDGAWRAFDIFYDYGRPNQEMQVIFWEVSPASPIDYPGIAD